MASLNYFSSLEGVGSVPGLSSTGPWGEEGRWIVAWSENPVKGVVGVVGAGLVGLYLKSALICLPSLRIG